MFCAICNADIDANNHQFTRVHLKHVHNITAKEYYDTYLKQVGDGVCRHESCSNSTEFKDLQGGYRAFCSRTCLTTSSDRKQKTRLTNISRYGAPSATQTQSTKDKITATLLDRYGVNHQMHLQSTIDKIRTTSITKYGVDHPMKCAEVSDRVKQTNVELYGTTCVFANEDVKRKIAATNTIKYGTLYPLQNKTIQDKAKITNMKAYGTPYASQSEYFKRKVAETILSTYGFKGSHSHPDVYDRFISTRRKNYWDVFVAKLMLKNIKPLFTTTEYSDPTHKIFSFTCTECNKTISTEETNPQRIYCTCMRFRSKYEREIADWLSTIVHTDIELNVRKQNREMDIFLPKMNIGIDFHGLFWHADINRDRNYHQDKLKHFESLGITFIQILENEWINKRPIVESIIKKRLSILDHKIAARKCELIEISKRDHDLFIELNHIQGTAPTSVRYGLFHNNELVSVMSFAKSRYSKKHTWELIRFSNKLGVSVIGGAARLLKAFTKTYTGNIISYCDIRLFNGSMYTSIGLTYSHRSAPDYFYFMKNTINLEHRSVYQKHKLSAKLATFDPEQTEYENMTNNKFYRIFDAGNDVYELIR